MWISSNNFIMKLQVQYYKTNVTNVIENLDTFFIVLIKLTSQRSMLSTVESLKHVLC